ncbi:MAG: hypothetical protein HKP36_11600 [Myxococcales bacterium]|nr:hypothetical protein [Deltaproteobacteria bacterium]NNL25084.1 hypothetical protein [Myxococcales bacterium]
MRPIPTLIPILTLLSLSLSPAAGAAQEENQDESRDGDATVEAEADVIAQEPDLFDRDALAYNAEILDELLTRSAEQTIREKKFAAAAGIAGGSILLGLSAWRLLENPPGSQYTRGLGVMFMTLGMADLTTGVFAAVRASHERRRLERWQKSRSQGITRVELAHFEGELQASQELREGERLLVRWAALTHALAGALVLAFTPIPGIAGRADSAAGYIIGAVFFSVGMATFGASFRKTPSEKAWSEYNSRKRPMPGHEFSWGLAPSVSRRGAGLSFGGTF